MSDETINLRVDIPPSMRLAYEDGLARQDLAGIRRMLLSACEPMERAAIERLLPQALVDQIQVD